MILLPASDEALEAELEDRPAGESANVVAVAVHDAVEDRPNVFLADVLEELEACRAKHIVGRRLARKEREDRRKDVALVEPAVDKVRVDLEAGPEEADGGCSSARKSARQCGRSRL